MQKILVVDDHADIRRLIRIALGSGFEILEAEDGETALHLIQTQQPALVVLDIMMPGMLDGLAVLDAVKTDPLLAATQIIMVSARGQAQDYEDGMRRGALAYFIKPFSPNKLAVFIRECLA